MSAIEKLTDRQKECLRLLPSERSAKAIAIKLGISDQTVEVHLKAARKMLGVNDSYSAAQLLADHEVLLPPKCLTGPRGFA